MTKDETKIMLSAKELELVCNTEWILTKQVIIQKVIELFSGSLSVMQTSMLQQKNDLPTVMFLKDPKISRGENYRGLPYVMLDYPRFFDKQNTVAIRIFFWWGNFFSVTLQLSGEYKSLMEIRLLANFVWLQQNEYWLCVNDQPWEHAFDAANFIPFHQVSVEEFTLVLNNKSFVKISKKKTLQHWDTAVLFIEQSFEELLAVLKN
ncbi:hypothetical protein QWZ08_03655 [Ferruginibacter paludis]|uniref:hypothetical protein n=1 Tax=Ferruginibacter paludis TaxID=1310417 RepID=UPI0025B4FB69|nr:hypothetical protein [Ferruginibacter paludis]MDN3654708.1 hypothetical protein [Ferruginibacter paludis]